MERTHRGRSRTTLGLAMAASLAVPLLFAACGPKRTGPGTTAPTPAASPTASPIPWLADARLLLRVGLGVGRPLWGTPPIKPGEKLTWFVTTEPPSTGLRRVTVVHDAADPSRWHLSRLPLSGALEVALSADGARAESIAWSTSGAAPAIVTAPEQLAALWTPPVMLIDSSFTAAGGTFVGNEVVRVPAGVFRARHALLRRDGIDWHLYVARGIPGGLVKVERFSEGSASASLVLELDGFTRLRGEPHPR